MMKSCCCCLNLRQGSLGSAIYSIVLCVIVLGYAGFQIAMVNNAEESQVKDRFSVLRESIYDSLRVSLYIIIAVYVFWLLCSILVIIAAKKANRWCLLPWIIFTCILCALMGWRMIAALANASKTFSSGAAIFQFTLCVVMFAVNLYCLVCVSSFFKELTQEARQQPSSVGYKA